MATNEYDYWDIQRILDFVLLLPSGLVILISPFHSFGLTIELVAGFMFIMGLKFLFADLERL